MRTRVKEFCPLRDNSMNKDEQTYLLSMLDIYHEQGMKLLALGKWDNVEEVVDDNGEPVIGEDGKPKKRFWGKIPTSKDWLNQTFSKRYLENHIKDGNNIGFLLGDKDLVIDVDPRNGGSESLDQLILDTGYDFFEECPTVYTGSNGYHFYLQKSDEIKFREELKEYPGIEFKTVGRQVVIPGSIHPNGRQYRLDDNSTEFDFMPDVPEVLIELIQRQHVDVDNDDYQGIMTPAELADLLSHLPVDCYDTNAEWFKMLAAAHHATDGVGVEEFIDWSTSDPKYANDGRMIRRRWESLGKEGKNSISYRSLIHEAKKYDYDTSSFEASLDFDDAELLEDKILDIEDAQAQLSRLINTVDPLELIAELTANSHQDEIEECLLACLKAPTIVKMKALKQIQQILGLTAGDIKKLLKEVEEKKLKDLGEIVAGYVLKEMFENGDHLIYNIDGEFWHYSGTHWEQIREEWLSGQVLKLWQKIRDRIGIAQQTTGLVGQVMSILKMSRAVKHDVLGFKNTPKAVINCTNGELWIQADGSVKLKRHSYRSYLAYCLNVKYDKKADCPEWDKSLKQIFSIAEDQPNMIRHMEEIIGYLIQPNKNIASWFLLKGYGANGKSMIMDITHELIGQQSVLSTAIHDLSTNKNNHALASLPGKILILDDDLDTDSILPDGILKKISERKILEANPKGKGTYSFVSSATPVLLANYYPKAKDVSNGTRRRANIIPFDRIFSDDEIDRNLGERIKDNELSGVLNRALSGLKRLRTRGYFDKPTDCVKADGIWLDMANPVSAFMKECTDSAKEKSFVTLKQLYSAFERWSAEQGIHSRVMGKKKFNEHIQAMGFTVKKSTGNVVSVYGIKLTAVPIDDFDEEFDDDEL